MSRGAALAATLLASACTGEIAGGPGGGGASGGDGADATTGEPGGFDAGLADAAPLVAPPCDFAAPLPAPSSVLWEPTLSLTGAETLAGHGHDDGRGAVGYCAGTRVPGQPFYRLVAAGVGVDVDLDGSGSDADGGLGVGFWRDPQRFAGLGESGGKIAVYVDVVDASGQPLDEISAPDLRIRREILDGPTEDLPLTSKPPNEFQTNFPMVGGGARYGFAVAGASDRVINLRLPNNHHLVYLLVFEREPAE